MWVLAAEKIAVSVLIDQLFCNCKIWKCLTPCTCKTSYVCNRNSLETVTVVWKVILGWACNDDQYVSWSNQIISGYIIILCEKKIWIRFLLDLILEHNWVALPWKRIQNTVGRTVFFWYSSISIKWLVWLAATLWCHRVVCLKFKQLAKNLDKQILANWGMRNRLVLHLKVLSFI